MSETVPLTPELGIAEPVAEPTIHDQAYWDADLDQLAAQWEPFNGTPINEKPAEFMSFLWSSLLRYRGYVQQLALERPAVESAPKPNARRRAPKVKEPVAEWPDNSEVA